MICKLTAGIKISSQHPTDVEISNRIRNQNVMKLNYLEGN